MEPESEDGSLWVPVAWTAFALVVSVVAVGVVGFSAADSESAGVTATSLAALPVGFAVSGAIGAVVAHFLFRRSSVGRAATPLGCGCLGALALACGSFFFFAAIFPML